MIFLLLYLTAAFAYGFVVTYRAYAYSRLPVNAIDLLFIPLIWIGSGLLLPVFVGVWLFEQWERWQWRRVHRRDVAELEAEFSVGYAVRLGETPGVTPEGEPCDAVQRDIKYNHVALLPRDHGRAGPADFDLSDLEPDTQRSAYSEPPEVIEGGAEKLG